jgi:hypothetical protein
MILEGASIRLAKHLEQKTLRAAVVQVLHDVKHPEPALVGGFRSRVAWSRHCGRHTFNAQHVGVNQTCPTIGFPFQIALPFSFAVRFTDSLKCGTTSEPRCKCSATLISRDHLLLPSFESDWP